MGLSLQRRTTDVLRLSSLWGRSTTCGCSPDWFGDQSRHIWDVGLSPPADSFTLIVGPAANISTLS